MLLMPNCETTFDGPCQVIDFLGKKATRLSKSSLHAEALSVAQAMERAEKICGILEEIYFPYQTTAELLHRMENGEYRTPVEGIVDAKSLSDVLTSPKEPTPTDEGSLLWLQWARERMESGALQTLGWCTTGDMLADGTTKAGVDTTRVVHAMEGSLILDFSALRAGRILDPHKGLPPSKSQRDQSSAAFCELFHRFHGTATAFALAVNSGDSEGVLQVLRNRVWEEDENRPEDEAEE